MHRTCAPTYPLQIGPNWTIFPYDSGLGATKAALGETGKLTVTLTADGIEPVTKTVDVNVVEGVDLAAGKDTQISVKPGAEFTTELQVHNNSKAVVHGVAVIVDTDYAYASDQQFANCFYAHEQITACTFDQDLQPGATYQLTVPYHLRQGTAAPSTVRGRFEWLTPGDWDDLTKFRNERGSAGPGTPGTGDTLTLQQTATSAAAS